MLVFIVALRFLVSVYDLISQPLLSSKLSGPNELISFGQMMSHVVIGSYPPFRGCTTHGSIMSFFFFFHFSFLYLSGRVPVQRNSKKPADRVCILLIIYVLGLCLEAVIVVKITAKLSVCRIACHHWDSAVLSTRRWNSTRRIPFFPFQWKLSSLSYVPLFFCHGCFYAKKKAQMLPSVQW